MSIYQTCLRIIAEVNPRYWVIENVIGAVKYFGQYRTHFGPFYLWGNFPDLGRIELNYRKKESMSSTAAAERAIIPLQISRAIANAIEGQRTLFEAVLNA